VPQLRAATADDALCLGVLGLQVFLDTYATGGIRPTLAREVLDQFSTEAMRRRLERANGRLCVAELDGHLIGLAQLGLQVPHEVVTARRPAELERLYVQEPFTRRGIGSALLAWAERTAVQGGADLLWLTPWVHNQRARAFYRQLGYADIGSTWYRFENERHENRVLVKRLPQPGGGTSPG
jgi:GNAT superfamily N-acetyltransferase